MKKRFLSVLSSSIDYHLGFLWEEIIIFHAFIRVHLPYNEKSEGIINVVVCVCVCVSVSLTPFFLPSLHHRRMCVRVCVCVCECNQQQKSVLSPPNPLSNYPSVGKIQKKSVLMSVCVSMCYCFHVSILRLKFFSGCIFIM